MNRAEPPAMNDPRSFIDAPVIAALNHIVVRALIGFSVIAAFATFPLILHLDGAIHQAFHFLVPVAWAVYALLTAAILILRPAPREPDVWGRASEVDHGLATFTRRVSWVMPVGWLATFAVILVHHHLTSPRDVFVTFGIIVPLTLAAWILAVLAWNAWSRASLARAEHEAAARLRQHVCQLPRSTQPR